MVLKEHFCRCGMDVLSRPVLLECQKIVRLSGLVVLVSGSGRARQPGYRAGRAGFHWYLTI
jgi:hypothetical protein